MLKTLLLGAAVTLTTAAPAFADITDTSAGAAGYALGKIAFWAILIGVGASKLFGWGKKA